MIFTLVQLKVNTKDFILIYSHSFIYIYDFTVHETSLGYIVLSSSTFVPVLVSVTNSGAEANSIVLPSRPSPEPTSLGITRRPASVTDLTMLLFSLANPKHFTC